MLLELLDGADLWYGGGASSSAAAAAARLVFPRGAIVVLLGWLGRCVMWEKTVS